MISVHTSNTLRRVLSLLSVAILATTGCASKKKDVEVWTQKPLVAWMHVATSQNPIAESGYILIATGPTVGLFPANLGVTRVAIDITDEVQAVPHLTADPRNEFLRWNYAFDDLMAISDVFPISQRDLGGGEANPEQIISAFRALDAKLALIYGMNELAENESEMIGTLYNVRTSEPIASLRAHAVSLEVPEDAEDQDDPYLLWSTDSRAIVRDQFAEALHGCMRELILKDQAPALEDKSGWIPAGPIRPVVWPPQKHKYRRGRR